MYSLRNVGKIAPSRKIQVIKEAHPERQFNLMRSKPSFNLAILHFLSFSSAFFPLSSRLFKRPLSRNPPPFSLCIYLYFCMAVYKGKETSPLAHTRTAGFRLYRSRVKKREKTQQKLITSQIRMGCKYLSIIWWLAHTSIKQNSVSGPDVLAPHETIKTIIKQTLNLSYIRNWTTLSVHFYVWIEIDLKHYYH